jgi:(1->4)-alpha-D-glucan 1-alpha-D-glucosylmutase
MNDPQTHPLSEQLTESLRKRLRERQRLPVSTYRLQLNRGFNFRVARAVVPYLARLGITDVYCSPYLRARPGSTHGYDICDHSRLNPELGSETDYQAFVEALASHRMGHVLDFVPNHMAVDPGLNPWWRDVLEDGPASRFARYFDIDWHPVKPELDGKVLLPVLRDHYGSVLERGELLLTFSEGALALRYFEQDLPIDPAQYPRVLRTGLESLQAELSADDAHLAEFLSILTALDHLPALRETDAELVSERQREKKVARDRLARVVKESPPIRRHIEAALHAFNGQPGQPHSFDCLHELLEGQPYRLAYWRTAFDEINYRRFFDIRELGGVRMEEPDVFAATHELVLRLIREGKVTGLRLDHLDGLFDPAGYVESLQDAILQEWVSDLAPAEIPKEEWRRHVRAWRSAERKVAERPFYVVAEKIFSGQETLPESWPIQGTSGYDFLNDLNRLFVDAANAKAMKQVYERFTGQTQPFADVVYECKKLITWTALASELNVLAHALNRLSEGNRRARDFTLNSLREALREVVACYPVYRTYVSPSGATETDRQMIHTALARSRQRNPAMEPSVFDFLRGTLLPGAVEEIPQEEHRQCLDFAMKFQQYTGPVEAKGKEDTAFYRYNCLLSLNEVGGDPQRYGGTPAQFHEANRQRLHHWPSALLATATHDTKRGEDARARLNVLSEIPNEWRRVLSQWKRINAGNRSTVDREPAPDRNDEYQFYQALLGAWPAELYVRTAPSDLVDRLRDYMLKAVNEAKVHTSWINPNEAYDRAVAEFVNKTLTGARADKFLNSFLPFQQRIARLGMVNSLAQLVLKFVSPGVPDFYQGTELWDLSLVDPDNRRPIDFERRRRLLEGLEPALREDSSGTASEVAALLEHWQDGRIKLFITACGLRLRLCLPHVFSQGEYLPLEATGEQANHLVGVARRLADQVVLAVVPRLQVHLAATHFPIGPDTWEATRLVLPSCIPAGSFRNVITHERVETAAESGQMSIGAARALATCPVALLLR